MCKKTKFKIPTQEEIKENIRKGFKQDYLNFIYAQSIIVAIEYAYRTAADLFRMEANKMLNSDNKQKIWSFIINNLRTDQEWKKRLIGLAV